MMCRFLGVMTHTRWCEANTSISSGCSSNPVILKRTKLHSQKQRFYLTEQEEELAFHHKKSHRLCGNEAQDVTRQPTLCYWLFVGILILNKVTCWFQCCMAAVRCSLCETRWDSPLLLLREWIYSFTESKLNVRSRDGRVWSPSLWICPLITAQTGDL